LLGVFGLGLFLLLRWFENANLYFPVRNVAATPKVIGLTYDEVAFVAADGVRLQGWYVPADKPDAPVVLFFNGNGGNIGHRLEKLAILHGLGLSVLLFDYRGYGASSGRPSEKGLYGDGEAAYRYLREVRKVPWERLIVHGESLGGAVAVELASRLPVGVVILESTFASTVEMGKRMFPFLPVGLLIRQRYDNLSRIGRIESPLLVIHSPQDEIVPYQQGRRLFEVAPQPKSFLELQGSHNEGFLQSGKAYSDGIRDFLARHLPQQDGTPTDSH
jgi:fermentation-respiration switch protein FrsA (DUF1100 family)